MTDKIFTYNQDSSVFALKLIQQIEDLRRKVYFLEEVCRKQMGRIIELQTNSKDGFSGIT